MVGPGPKLPAFGRRGGPDASCPLCRSSVAAPPFRSVRAIRIASSASLGLSCNASGDPRPWGTSPADPWNFSDNPTSRRPFLGGIARSFGNLKL